MSISKLSGLAPDTGARPPGVVITGVTAAGRQAFQAKLVEAGKPLANINARQTANVASRQPPSAEQTKTPPNASGCVKAYQAVPGEKRDITPAQRDVGRPGAVAQRMRRFRSSTPKNVRKKTFQLAAELSLTLVDVWTDSTGCTVTLIVEQDGYAETRFEIENDGTKWWVAIHSERDHDQFILLREEGRLQARFDEVSLGRVSVAPFRDGRAKPIRQ